jgi:hypothetical protein
MREFRSYGSNGMDRPRSIGASVEEKPIVTWATSHGGTLVSVARRFAVKPSPLAHRYAAAGLSARGDRAIGFSRCEYQQKYLRTRHSIIRRTQS